MHIECHKGVCRSRCCYEQHQIISISAQILKYVNKTKAASLFSTVNSFHPGLPVDFPVKAITPEDSVVGHVQVQGHSVLLGGHHLAVLPLGQVDASDLVPVGEQQVRALPCTRNTEHLVFRARLWVIGGLKIYKQSRSAKPFRKRGLRRDQ